MHAVQMHDVMVESLSQKQKQMEEITSHINKSIQDTDTSETYNEKDMRQLINSVLTQVELPACAENGRFVVCCPKKFDNKFSFFL